ncbi:MAG: hypothetical protein L3J50_06075 [Emcibacter sp.]|nr:hypothetical protein [Emcibacter sp.]
MLYIKSKIFAILLVLLVFVGQTASADVMSCQMDAEIAVAADNATPTEHPEWNIDDMDSYSLQADMDGSECCLEDCGCPVGNLVSAILLNSPQHKWASPSFQKNSARSFLVVSQSPSTLFRPPIA